MDLKISFFIGLLLMLLVTFADWDGLHHVRQVCMDNVDVNCRINDNCQALVQVRPPVPTHYQVKQSPHKRKKEGFGFVPLKLLLLALYLLEHFHGMVVQSQGWWPM